MIRSFALENRRLAPVALPDDGTVWFDLLAPSPDEERMIETRLGLDVPTREDMLEIESSSRLYLEDGAAFMTAILPANADGDDPDMAPVTFVLAAGHLVTVRYHEPRAFSVFPARAEKSATEFATPEAVLLGLLETVVDRLADVLERAGREIDAVSHDIFRVGPRGHDLGRVLETVGRKGDLTSRMRDSLLSLERLAGFLARLLLGRKSEKETRENLKTLARDVRSLLDHAGFLSQKITFLLDATLGMISIEQSGIIKIFSVAAVIFLPPTLVASIYGMNFEHMPELGWLYGYPFALGLMVVSAIVPYLFFKRKRWL